MNEVVLRTIKVTACDIKFLFFHNFACLLQTHFYVTESSTHHYQVFYYRKAVWKCVEELAIRERRNSLFTSVSEVKSALFQTHHSFHCSSPVSVMSLSLTIPPSFFSMRCRRCGVNRKFSVCQSFASCPRRMEFVPSSTLNQK